MDFTGKAKSTMRSWRRGPGIGFIVLLFCAPMSAQESGNGSRPHFGPAGGVFGSASEGGRGVRDEAVRRFMEALRRAAPELEENHLRRLGPIVRGVFSRAAPGEVAGWMKQPPREVLQEIVRRWEVLRDERDDAFVAGLPAAEREKMQGLNRTTLRRRINEMRLAAQLETAITNAMKHGLISDDEAEDLRRVSPDDKVVAASRLNKQVFLLVRGEHIPVAERTRLEQLEPDEFWRDEGVQRWRLMTIFSRAEIDRLRTLPPEERRLFLESLRGRRPVEVLERLAGKDAAEQISELDVTDRKRLAEELERVHWPRRRRMGVPPHLFERLSEQQRREFFGFDDEERQKFLREHFPSVDWERQRERFDAGRRVDEILSRLTPWERAHLGEMRPPEAERLLRSRLGSDVDISGLMKDLRQTEFFGPRPPPWARRFLDLLPPGRRRDVERLPRDQMVIKLRELFPEATIPPPPPPRRR